MQDAAVVVEVVDLVLRVDAAAEGAFLTVLNAKTRRSEE
jgi:hypothetical protein